MAQIKLNLRDKVLLRPEEVAELLGISRNRTYQLIKSGALPSVRLEGGRLLRVPTRALLARYERPIAEIA